MGTPPGKPNRNPIPRTECKGWTDGATRRNREWLYSVDGDKLDGTPVAITLTLKDAPASHDEWQRLRDRLFKRLARMGLLRLHWVTEWTRRGLPHLHAAAYFGGDLSPLQTAQLGHAIRTAWLDLTAHLGTQYKAQHVVPITDAGGWFQYVAKHAARGVKHYQRQRDTLPPGWQKTGRVWGHLGDWPTSCMTFDVDHAASFKLRRLVRGYAVADARARRAAFVSRTPGLRRLPLVTESGAQVGWTWADLEHPERTHDTDQRMKAAARELRFSRRLLRCSDRRRAPCVGFSQWIPQRVMLQLLGHVADQGHAVTQTG